MSDLINRQQAIDVLEEQLDYLFMLNKKDNPTAESKWSGINWARNTIAELPTIDLVRCGECKHVIKVRSESAAEKFGQIYECRKEVLNCPNLTSFCSYGERRNDE